MRVVLHSAVLALMLGGVAPALAQGSIGEMALADGQVTGAFGGKSEVLRTGSGVVQNEVVATGADSVARVAFHDLTTLAIAQRSAVKLDRFVFNPDSTASRAAITMTRGAFRLITGNSPSKNLSVKTPSATIGLRGTVVDVMVRPGREIVVLQQGATTVCKGRQCVPVDVPGTGVIITASGVSAPTTDAAVEFDFDAMTRQRFYTYFQHTSQPRGDNRDSQSGSSSSSSQHN